MAWGVAVRGRARASRRGCGLGRASFRAGALSAAGMRADGVPRRSECAGPHVVGDALVALALGSGFEVELLRGGEADVDLLGAPFVRRGRERLPRLDQVRDRGREGLAD